MVGYHKDPVLTAACFTEDGFLKTGDRGEIDEMNRLKLTGRVKELFKTSKGKYVAPAPIENLLNSDNQNSMMAKEGLFPSYLPALASPVYSEPDPYFGGQPAMRVFADLTSTIPAISYTGDYAKASEIVANATVEAILNGKDAKATLQDAAATIAKQTNREIG